ncbi:TonB-dependent receptor [Pandoraea sp. PE-S2R-1]|uniref:TonB-dependent siderophore receptor n=1 Tax=Pandoraea sp. PE-S2R-1 TaxID=1986994 RepID=UPI000B402B30|nr:TonB-dependent receptor [Pandoraea sp. PE-S2R-1]
MTRHLHALPNSKRSATLPHSRAIDLRRDRQVWQRATLISIAVACLCAASLPTEVRAQTPTAANASVAAMPLDLTLPAQPLALTIDALARQSGVGIGYDASLAVGKVAPALQGRMTLGDALARALAGSGLAVSISGRTVSIHADTVALPATNVTAGTQRVTEGTGSYTTRVTDGATRMDLSLRETPQSMTVITRQQIEDQNLMSLTDVLRQTPGIVVDTLDERASFSSRGFDLATMIDGVPTLSYDTIAGMRNLLSMVMYDRIDVIRGPAGLLNGVGNPGGAINLVRKRPGKEFAGYVTAGGGSWGRYDLEADVGGKLNESGSLRARVVGSHTAGNNFVDDKRSREDVFYGIVEADVTDNTTISVGYEYQKNKIHGANFGQSPLFYSKGAATNLPRSFNSSTPWSLWNMTTDRVFVDLDHRFDSGWKVKAEGSWTRNQRERYSGDIWLYPANINANTQMGTMQLASNPAYGINKAFDVYATGPYHLFGRTHQATFGASINHNDYNYGNDSAVPNAFDRRPVNILDLGSIAMPSFAYPLNRLGGTTQQTAIYAATQIKPIDRVSVILGGRFTWYRATSWARYWNNGTNGAMVTGAPIEQNAVFTPYAGLVVDVSEDFSLYSSYTSIFTPNTVQDTSGNTLAPKRGNNIELGLKGEHFGGRLNTAVAIFRTYEDNLAVADGTLTPGGTAAYKAVSGAKTQGFEATVAGQVLPGWQVQAGYTYSAKRDRSGALVNPTYPQRLLRIATTYRLPGVLSKVTIGGSLSYQSAITYVETYSGLTARQGGITLIDLLARYDVTRQLSVSLNLGNVTDKRYWAGLGGYNGYTYGAPRNGWVKLTYRF